MTCKKICENCTNSYMGYGESSLNYTLRCDQRDDMYVSENDTCSMFDKASRFIISELRDANKQLAEKIKLLDLQRENSEFKLKDTLKAYRIQKEALEYYADEEHMNANYPMNKVAEEALEKVKEIK